MDNIKITTEEHRNICHVLWVMRMKQYIAMKYIHEINDKPFNTSWEQYKIDYSKKNNLKGWYNIYKAIIIIQR